MQASALRIADAPHLHGVRVLVVDDMLDVRDVVTEILERGGAVVTAVGSAEEALEVLQRERPDVLLSDLSMPDKGGDWLIGQVRALPPERGGATPAAVFSAYTSPEQRAGVLPAGFQIHVDNPVGVLDLIDVVATLARSQRVQGVDIASSMR